MAWPKDLSRITTDLSTTELWWLKERMSAPNSFEVVSSSGFAEYSEFTIELPEGRRYRITEFVEEIDSVECLS